MKNLLIVLLLFVIENSAIAQSLNKNRTEYFILGTLADSEGRYIDPKNKNEFDYYFEWEKSLVSLIDSMLKSNYPKTSFTLTQNEHPQGIPRYYFINSDSLSYKFNRYYNFRQTGTFTSPDNQPIYYGILNDSIFKSDDQKLAFLAGVYMRFGEKTDTAWCIHISESASKVHVCYDLLKEFNCSPTYVRLDNIPTQNLVYFHPTERVKAYLKKYAYLNMEILEARAVLFKRIFDQYRKKE